MNNGKDRPPRQNVLPPRHSSMSSENTIRDDSQESHPRDSHEIRMTHTLYNNSLIATQTHTVHYALMDSVVAKPPPPPAAPLARIRGEYSSSALLAVCVILGVACCGKTTQRRGISIKLLRPRRAEAENFLQRQQQQKRNFTESGKDREEKKQPPSIPTPGGVFITQRENQNNILSRERVKKNFLCRRFFSSNGSSPP